MSDNVILTGLVLGLDSLIVCMSLGGWLPERGHRIRLALWFAVCDGLASFIGLAGGIVNLRPGVEWGQWLGPAVLMSYGAYVLYVARHCRDVAAKFPCPGWLTFCLPICLSLDNLIAGMARGAAGTEAITAGVIFGSISGVMALGGLTCGATLGERLSMRAWRLSGSSLVIAAVGLVLKESLLG